MKRLWQMYYRNNQDEVDNFVRLVRYFVPFKWRLAVSVACAGLVSAATAATAQLLEPTMNRVFVEQDREFLKVIPWLIIGLFFVKGVFRFLQNYILRATGERVIAQLRSELYRHYQYLDARYFTDNKVGVMMSRITNDVNMMQRAVPSMVSLFREPLTMLFLVGVAFYNFWQAALFVFIIFPLTAIPVAQFGRRLRKWVRRGQERMGEMNSILKETFSGVRVIKAFGMEEYEIKRFDDENERVYHANIKALVFEELSSPSIEALGAIGAAVVVVVGGGMVINGTITTGSFFAFMGALGLSYEPLKKLNKMYVNFQAALAAASRVFEVLDTPPDTVDRPGAVSVEAVNEGVRLEGVKFRYEDDGHNVLDGIDLDVTAGQMIALVGSSGAGKTTLVNLLPRFWDVSEGRIAIDGRDIRDIELVSLRRLIGMVTQDVFLFGDSVKSNIAYGHDQEDMDRVIAAAKDANAHDFVQNLPNGYDTLVGEMGVKISGGQRQRLAIARALYKNAPILILDEATSSLDAESEREVQVALERLLVGRTSFVIAHRLSTVQRADRIIVLKDGRVVEDGRHEQLIERGGEYARLYSLQFDTEGPSDAPTPAPEARE